MKRRIRGGQYEFPKPEWDNVSADCKNLIKGDQISAVFTFTNLHEGEWEGKRHIKEFRNSSQNKDFSGGKCLFWGYFDNF